MTRGEVIHGDAAAVLEQLTERDGWDRSRTVVYTDPPWVGCEHIPINGSDDAVGVWSRAAKLIPAVADRLILHLGRNSDPRAMLAAVPASMPFATTITLRMVPPGYRGPFMSGDVAYVFGKMRMPRRADGTLAKVLPGEITSNTSSTGKERAALKHPCPRSPEHAAALVHWYCAQAEMLVDMFCGSGTGLVAAARAGLSYVGVDNDARWVTESRERLEREHAQGDLFRPPDLEVGQLVIGGGT